MYGSVWPVLRCQLLCAFGTERDSSGLGTLCWRNDSVNHSFCSFRRYVHLEWSERLYLNVSPRKHSQRYGGQLGLVLCDCHLQWLCIECRIEEHCGQRNSYGNNNGD